jgi:hypothetical protein
VDEKLRKFNIFFPKDTFTCEIVNILCLYEYFGLYTVPPTFRDIISISPTTHSFPQLTAILTKGLLLFPQQIFHNSFSTTHSSQQLFQKPRPNQTHPNFSLSLGNMHVKKSGGHGSEQ